MNSKRAAATIGALGLSATACGADQTAPPERDESSAIEYADASVLIWTDDHMAAFNTHTGEVHFSSSIDEGTLSPDPPEDDWGWTMGAERDEEHNVWEYDPDRFTAHWLPTEEGGDITTQEIELTDVEGLETANLVYENTYYEASPTEPATVYSIRAEINETAECMNLYALRLDLQDGEAEVVDSAQQDEEMEARAFLELGGPWLGWGEDVGSTSTMCTADDNPSLDTPTGDILPLQPGENPEEEEHPFYSPQLSVGEPDDHSAELESVGWVDGSQFYEREEDGLYYALEDADDGLGLYRMNPNGTYEEIDIPDEVDLGDYEDSFITTLPYGA